MQKALHTVVEMSAYLRNATILGVSEATRGSIVDFVAREPLAGDELVGSGGIRKFRFAGRGKGKSGGYRILSLYVEEDCPVFLIAILSKGERANFSASEINAFRQLSEGIKRQWRKKKS